MTFGRATHNISSQFAMMIRIPALIGSMAYDEEDEEISTDLWQEACWIVIR